MSSAPQPVDDRIQRWGQRDFSAFGIANRISCVPVDDDEETWFDEFNSMLRALFEHTVFPQFPPRGVKEPLVLDCGYGTGAWIDDLLQKYDGCYVTGVDTFLGGTQDDDEDEEEQDADAVVQEFEKIRWNLNASFTESELRRQTFDLINSRFLADGINRDRWWRYVLELKGMLKPGGWLQMVEMYPMIQSDAGRDKPYLDAWWSKYQEAMLAMNKEPRIAPRLEGYLRAARFEQVTEQIFDVPIGGWKRGLSTLGEDNVDLISSMLESRSMVPFVQLLGMNPRTEYAPLIERAKRELARPNLRLYFRIYVAYGRNPVSSR